MSKIMDRLARIRLREGQRSFTRAKALRQINLGNCEEERFSKHKNKNVRRRAEHLAAKKNAEVDTPSADVE